MLAIDGEDAGVALDRRRARFVAHISLKAKRRRLAIGPMSAVASKRTNERGGIVRVP
jgi:hypothetical protein